jgi:lipoic acid synthetase
MVGLGEAREELRGTFADLAEAGVERLTVGQYLQPSRRQIPVERYLPPEEFDALGTEAREAGIRFVLSGPLVRSSYHAGTLAEGDAPPHGGPR